MSLMLTCGLMTPDLPKPRHIYSLNLGKTSPFALDCHKASKPYLGIITRAHLQLEAVSNVGVVNTLGSLVTALQTRKECLPAFYNSHLHL